MHVRLAAPLTNNVPRVGPNDLDAKIITFHPFYFSLGFTFPLLKFFKKVFCVMECATSQYTPNVYRAIIYFDHLNHFFKMDLMVQLFFYFFKVGRTLWHAYVLEVSGRWEGEVGNGLSYFIDLL